MFAAVIDESKNPTVLIQKYFLFTWSPKWMLMILGSPPSGDMRVCLGLHISSASQDACICLHQASQQPGESLEEAVPGRFQWAAPGQGMTAALTWLAPM